MKVTFDTKEFNETITNCLKIVDEIVKEDSSFCFDNEDIKEIYESGRSCKFSEEVEEILLNIIKTNIELSAYRRLTI